MIAKRLDFDAYLSFPCPRWSCAPCATCQVVRYIRAMLIAMFDRHVGNTQVVPNLLSVIPKFGSFPTWLDNTVLPRIIAGCDYFFFPTKRGRLFEGGDYFKYFRQRGTITRGRRLIEGRLLFEETGYFFLTLRALMWSKSKVGPHLPRLNHRTNNMKVPISFPTSARCPGVTLPLWKKPKKLIL